jgi:flagellar biosynthesis/type III secretory pathway M-ring protein FliF/YscJ
VVIVGYSIVALIVLLILLLLWFYYFYVLRVLSKKHVKKVGVACPQGALKKYFKSWGFMS